QANSRHPVPPRSPSWHRTPRMAGMSAPSLRIAAISLHPSPLEEPGGADAGGMNVLVLEHSLALARLGHRVDLFTRRSDPAAPAARPRPPGAFRSIHSVPPPADLVKLADGLRLHHLVAGPAAPLAKSARERAITPFRAALREALRADGHAPEGRSPDWDIIQSH